MTTTTERGYGHRHQQERKRLAPIVARGETVCARHGRDPQCPGTIQPDQPWDLGHTDDRTDWTGPEHVGCNRRAGARASNGKPEIPFRPRSRQW